jgi:hypothetical protein
VTTEEELIGRLGSLQASVRRVAVHDLAARGSTGVLLGHLPGERDEKAALLIIRCLGEAGVREAAAALLALYQDPETSARVAVAAIRVHDGLAA